MTQTAAVVSDPGRIRAADRVYDELQTAVLAGELPPGARLSVPRLAVRFGVSRSPVREAVQRLVQDGLATEAPHRGGVVATVTAAELIPLYEVREVLEGLAARLAARHASRNDLAQLHAELLAHERAVERGDIRAHIEHDIAFHARLRQAAGNAELSSALHRIQGKVTLAMLTADHTRWPAKAIAEHRAILDGIIAADAGMAEKVARAHIARIREDIAIQQGHES
jgi:DNA-binding GntR family transcriptional regulator